MHSKPAEMTVAGHVAWALDLQCTPISTTVPCIFVDVDWLFIILIIIHPSNTCRLGIRLYTTVGATSGATAFY
jgi:hypothetical protein